jgi:hypothetical protein
MDIISLCQPTHAYNNVYFITGEVLGVLCGKIGPAVYQECKEYVLRLIQSNLERQVADDDGSKHEQLETEKLMEKLAGPSQRVSCYIVHLGSNEVIYGRMV